MTDIQRDEYCAVAIAETFRGDGEILISPIGNLPAIGARLARLSFEPGLMLSDGVSKLFGNTPGWGVKGAEKIIEGYVPYRTIFDIVWSGKRHVMMGATQIDKYGNQNIACIGDFKQPKSQLLGMRGAPGNTISHPTSYWVSKHSTRVFVEKVDVVSGVGYDRARELGNAAKYHEIRRVVTNLCVLDFETPDNRMRLRSLHPGVTVDQVVQNTGFELVIPDDVPETRAPSAEELRLLREDIDPNGNGKKEVPTEA
jgi:acyl CoA:acetate/3-ketoacid CoA transferase beta subunit